MAHAVTGKDGAITWGGGAVNGKILEWEMEFTSESADDRGAGESWAGRLGTFADWRGRFRCYALDQADWSLSSTTAETSLINATTTFALKRKSGDANPWFTTTGLTTRIRRVHGINASSEYEVEVVCSEGTAPTIDTTPAT